MKYRLYSATLGLGLLSLLAYADNPVNLSTCHPERLRCEYLVNPLGLDVVQPRLDWILVGTKNTPRHLTQTGYQVLVASSKELLAQDKGDLWDSGQVNSDESSQIVYAGSPLTSREACFWKIRAWDSTGKITPWSETASWEMGLLQPGDWSTKWLDASKIVETQAITGTLTILHATYEAIDNSGSKDVTDIVTKNVKNNAVEIDASNSAFGGDPTPLHKKQVRVKYAVDGKKQEVIIEENDTLTIPKSRESIPYLRKDFTLSKPIAKARMYVTALGLYDLHLNGQRIGDHLLAPDWTDYAIRCRYQEYDVTSLVKSGANALGAMVGNGWYCGHIGNGGFQDYGTEPALFAQLEVTYTDGSTERIVTDGSWKKHPGPITSSDMMLGEHYDAMAEVPDWDQPGLDTSSWSAASERTEAPRALDGQVDQPVRQTGELHAKSMKEPAPGHYVYDFGQNMVGFVRLHVTAPAGTRLTLRHAEMLNSDGTMYTQNLRGAPSIDTYVCKGGGGETWQPHFTFHGFRYAEISGLPKAPGKDALSGIVIGTDIPHTGDFNCSNPSINQLQSNIQWGMRGNYLAVPTDCPQRDERMGWMGDAEVFVKTATYNGDVAAFFTKWLVDVDDAQWQDGRFTDVSPNPSGRSHGGAGVPAWGDAGVICPWTIYLMYGDKRILQQHLPAMTKWIDWNQAHSTNLLRDHDRSNDYGDWLSQGESTPKDLIGTAYFAYSTSLVAKSYRAIGDNANADKYENLAKQIKDAFVKAYADADGRLKGGTQADYAMALRFDLLPDDMRGKAGQYLDEDVVAHHDHLTTGFVGVSYLLPALTSVGEIETAYRLFMQDTFPSWLFSVKHGATTIWERWDGWTPEKGFQDPGMNSFNHYSLGSCGEWMFDTVAGIGVDPADPGFHHIVIHPQPGGGLTSAQGTFDSIHGKVSTNWTLQGETFTLHVTVPINTTATVELPSKDAKSMQEGGRPTADVPDIKAISGNQFVVGSGDYTFTCRIP
jgi:alpha-L-rhamnosidase